MNCPPRPRPQLRLESGAKKNWKVAREERGQVANLKPAKVAGVRISHLPPSVVMNGRCGLRGWAPVLKTGWPSGPGSTPSPSSTLQRLEESGFQFLSKLKSGFDSLSFLYTTRRELGGARGLELSLAKTVTWDRYPPSPPRLRVQSTQANLLGVSQRQTSCLGSMKTEVRVLSPRPCG